MFVLYGMRQNSQIIAKVDVIFITRVELILCRYQSCDLKHSYVIYQRVNLNFPMFVPWFSYHLP